jgi:hypothetical protein
MNVASFFPGFPVSPVRHCLLEIPRYVPSSFFVHIHNISVLWYNVTITQ